MTKIEQIFKGWAALSFKHLGFKPTREQAGLTELRLLICDSCNKRKDNRCELCGCNLAAKTLVKESKCPMGNW